MLNQARYKGCKILPARKNLGCGSSREHAPWALDDYGFRVILAPSFADIFLIIAENGLLPIVLKEEIIESLFKEVEVSVGFSLKVDLERQLILSLQWKRYSFEVDEFRKYRLNQWVRR